MRDIGELWRSLWIALIVGVVAFVASALAAGGGHGVYFPAKVVFPYSMALTGLTNEITLTLLVIALVQFPVYAFCLWVARRDPMRRWRWPGLACVHLVAVVLAFLLSAKGTIP